MIEKNNEYFFNLLQNCFNQFQQTDILYFLNKEAINQLKLIFNNRYLSYLSILQIQHFIFCYISIQYNKQYKLKIIKSDNKIGEQGFAALGSFLEGLNNLSELALAFNNNNLENNEVKDLYISLAKCKKISKLTLISGNNHMHKNSIIHLGQALMQLNNLSTLSIKDHDLTCQGFLGYLKSCQRVSFLKLDSMYDVINIILKMKRLVKFAKYGL
ncbi:hypothetical protein TTHERM_01302860 (macronuclear) [Tetrahymena thermophila SB210]|uniref:Kinase domain protein n=1 Tax=Tetrahymena thermophila (strain SB210) TaxID=312017 RepID=Q232B3_TETTS|nr:hypothetical protein TTHERM_01302860 [Tetrahymena thermophila SB210]EAR91379.3 hypothetical protein TTHERM_01302860 [Tetrahymena thermophila SB210]|eukprot:XP_001011624.3 hypothetical protein TTHERM_01302860 [Tetrahymena thermophila SB210]